MTGWGLEPAGVSLRQIWQIGRRVLAGCALILCCACISAGTREITDPEVVSRIKAEQSTKDEVAALLGLPLAVYFPQKGEEEWNYPFLTEYPGPTKLIPVVKAYTSMNYKTRVLTVVFNRQGIVKRVEQAQQSGDETSVPKYF